MPFGFFFHGGHGGVQHDGVENFFHPLVQRKNQIAVSAGKQAGSISTTETFEPSAA